MDAMLRAAAINLLARTSRIEGGGGGGGIPCVLFVGVDDSAGYLWPSKLQIKTVIVHSFAGDRSASRKSVYASEPSYRPSYSLLNSPLYTFCGLGLTLCRLDPEKLE